MPQAPYHNSDSNDDDGGAESPVSPNPERDQYAANYTDRAVRNGNEKLPLMGVAPLIRPGGKHPASERWVRVGGQPPRALQGWRTG